MVSMHIVYDGNKKSTVVHDSSGGVMITDAPKDIGGDGSFFSPTDLVGAALGSCIATTMAMFAERHEIDLSGLKLHVVKEMTTSVPRKIVALKTTVTVPAGRIPVEQRETYERVGRMCPVKVSLHPDIDASVDYIYED
jgi:putative redox protein